MTNKLILAFVFAFTGMVSAQQVPQSYLYGYNLFLINPALSGTSNCTEISMSHHNQWVKLEGAPITNHLTVSTRLRNHWGVGGQFMLDKIGMLQQVSALGNVSYGFYFGKQSLRLGLSVGYNNYRVNPSNAVAFDLLDPIVNGGNQSAGAISSDIGIAYKVEGFYVFGSVKQLLKTYSNFGYTNLPGYVQRAHYMMGAGYDIPLNNTWEMRPNVLLRSINNVMQADLNVDANYKSFVYFGAGFRSQVGLVARAGITVKETFFFGYAYEAPLANIASYSSGSHEVMLKMTICRPERTKVVKTKTDTIVKTLERIDTVFITQTERLIDTVFIDHIWKQGFKRRCGRAIWTIKAVDRRIGIPNRHPKCTEHRGRSRLTHADGASQRDDFHAFIALSKVLRPDRRSGRVPNQISNAKAPCPTNMPRPLRLRLLTRSAASKNAVFWGA